MADLTMGRQDWTVNVALAITIAVAALSVFFVAVGLPESYVSVRAVFHR